VLTQSLSVTGVNTVIISYWCCTRQCIMRWEDELTRDDDETESATVTWRVLLDDQTLNHSTTSTKCHQQQLTTAHNTH